MQAEKQQLKLTSRPSRLIQRGQVFPLGIALLLFGTLGGLVLYNTAQMASDKTRLANTADAAAYSGLQWQARALNFQAYTNRAMVANQVSIAQGVSLRSWAAYGVISTENIEVVLGAVPVLNVIASGAQQVMNGVERIVGPIAEGMVKVIDQVNQGLSLAQEAMFYGAFTATPAIVDSVVSETDSRFSVLTGYSAYGMAQNMDSWNEFTQGYETDDIDAMRERQDMINASLDDFSKERNWEFFDFWFYSTPITRHKMYRRGTTKLTMVQGEAGINWEWKAKDTLSLHNRIWRPLRSEKKIEVPIGWAQSFANSAGADYSIEPCSSMRFSLCQYPRYVSPNKTAEALSDRNVPSLRLNESRINVSGYTGVQAYRSLSQATIDEEEPAVRLKVEVAMSMSDVRSTEALGVGKTFDTEMKAIGDEASSISIAEVYYERPDTYLRQNPPRENANGYNPYWDVRLSPIEDQQRLLALSLRAASGGTVPSGGGGGNEETVPQDADETSSSESTDLAGENPASARKVTGAQGLRLESLAGGGMSLPDFQIPNSIDVEGAVQALISAYGASALPDDYRQYLALIQAGDPQAIAEHFAGVAIDDFRNTIEEHLENVLRDAVADMLRGIASDYASSVIGTDIEDLAEGVEEIARDQIGELIDPEFLETILETAEEGRERMLELRDEYERIREEVVYRFEVSMEGVSQAIAGELDSLQAEIGPLEAELWALDVDDSFGQGRIERELEPLYERRDELKSDDYLSEELEDELMLIFDEVADDPSAYTRELARYMVRELLREASGELEFPWAEELGEEEEGFDDSDETLEEIRASTLQ